MSSVGIREVVTEWTIYGTKKEGWELNGPSTRNMALFILKDKLVKKHRRGPEDAEREGRFKLTAKG